MVDARIPERYLTDRQILRLSDAERSSLFMATVWSVSNRTDGRIERDDLALIPTFKESTIVKLVQAGLLLPEGADAWIIGDYSRTQTTRTEFEILDNARRREREKKQRQRAKPHDAVPGDVPGGQSRGTSQAGQAGQEGKAGQDYSEALESWIDEATGEVQEPVTSWPTVVPGSGAWSSPDAPGNVVGRRAS